MTYEEPPEGWVTFGTLLEYTGWIEFSKDMDDEGFPKWERLIEDWAN